MTLIHPTALVDKNAQLAADVSVGPFSIIGPDVVIGPGCAVHNHVTIAGATTLGSNVQVHSGAVLGGAPQDLKYKGGKTTLSVGDNCVIRECCTLNLGTELGGAKTVVGNNCLIMAYAHIAHDCWLRNNIVIANAVQLAGHVHVHDGARIGGVAAIHHFTTIGTCAYIGGLARVTQDVPPFTMAEGHPAKVKALNKEGMKRRGMSDEVIEAIKVAYKRCFRDPETSRELALKAIEEKSGHFPEVRLFIDFLRATNAGKFGRALEAEREVVPLTERDGKLHFKVGS